MELFVKQIGRVLVDSIAGVGTTVVIPSLDLSVDMGFLVRPAIRTSTVAITHLHTDHIAVVHGYLGVRKLYGKGKAKFVVPREVEDAFLRYLRAMDKLQPIPFDWMVYGIESGISPGIKPGYVLESFPTTHSIPSLGYAVVYRKLKLKKEYLHLSGEEVAARRARGNNDLFELVKEPMIVITGDTTLQGILKSPYVRKARTLLVECTFLDKRKDIPAAHLGNHIHLDELIPLLDSWEKDGDGPGQVVLYHISQLYKPHEAFEIVNSRLPDRLKSRILVVPPRWP